LPSAFEAVLGVAHATSIVAEHVRTSSAWRTASALYRGNIPSIGDLAGTARTIVDLTHLLPQEARALVRKIRYGQADLAKCLQNLSHAENETMYKQILAQELVYCNLPDGYIIPQSPYFDCPGYRITKTSEFPGGLKAMILTPLEENGHPLMLFRGTNPGNYHNVLDDMSMSIGAINFSRYGTELKTEIEQLAARFGRIDIAGHSYGGAVAQIVTAHCPELIKSCTIYNAPGAGLAATQTFSDNLRRMPFGIPKPKMSSYRHAKDIVSLVGGSMLPCDRGCNYTYGTLRDPISYIDAHSASIKPDDILREAAPNPAYLRDAANFIEQCRQGLSHIIPFYRDLVGK